MAVSIYGLVDPATNELRYVGQTHFSLKHRLHGHIKRAEDPKRKSPVFCWLRKMIGEGRRPDVFELECCEGDQAADEAEEFYIAYYRAIGCRLTNHAIGGRVNRGFKHSAAWSAEASRRRKGVSGLSNKGKRRTPEQKARISAATKAAWTRHPHPQKGRSRSPELRGKISATLKARDIPISEETRKLLSESSKNHWEDPEYRQKAIRRGERHQYFGKCPPKHTMEAAWAASRLRRGIPKPPEHARKMAEGVRRHHAAKRAAKAAAEAENMRKEFEQCPMLYGLPLFSNLRD